MIDPRKINIEGVIELILASASAEKLAGSSVNIICLNRICDFLSEFRPNDSFKPNNRLLKQNEVVFMSKPNLIPGRYIHNTLLKSL